MVFSKRMEALADLCQGARRVIDVGCDHAFLCALLVTEYGVEHAFASDIRPGPLENARRTIAELGLESRITPVLSDGLDAFGPGDGDTVIIAGMGGEEMTLILSRAPWAGDNGGQVILQPMTNIPKLRQWLEENGYNVKKERVIKEGCKVYTAMNIQKGADESPGVCIFIRIGPFTGPAVASLQGKAADEVRRQRPGPGAGRAFGHAGAAHFPAAPKPLSL